MVTIEKIEREDHLEMIIAGEVDASSSITLDDAMKFAIDSYDKIIINLEKLEYISSAGLGVFMSYIEEIEKKEIHLWLYGMNESVFHIFEILGIDQLLNIVKTESEAIKKIHETPA